MADYESEGIGRFLTGGQTEPRDVRAAPKGDAVRETPTFIRDAPRHSCERRMKEEVCQKRNARPHSPVEAP